MTALGIFLAGAIVWFLFAPREVGKHAAIIVDAYRKHSAELRAKHGAQP